MKKMYEQFNKCYFMSFVFLILLLTIVIFMFSKKLIIYKVYEGVLFKQDVIVLILSNEELKQFNKNQKLYINNESYKFNISKVDSNILERNGDKYNEVFFELDISNMYKVNDVVKISIMDSRVGLFKIFSVIWDGD